MLCCRVEFYHLFKVKMPDLFKINFDAYFHWNVSWEKLQITDVSFTDVKTNAFISCFRGFMHLLCFLVSGPIILLYLTKLSWSWSPKGIPVFIFVCYHLCSMFLTFHQTIEKLHFKGRVKGCWLMIIKVFLNDLD